MQENFGESKGITESFDLKDTTYPLQTMSETSGQSKNYFGINKLSTKEASFEDLKQECILVLDVKDENTYVHAMKQHVSYGVWRKDCHRHIVRKPPDRLRSTVHEYADPFIRYNLPSNSGSECAEENMDLLKTRGRILKIKQDQRDYLSEVSLSKKHTLENMIVKLQEALVCEKEKSMNLERELNEIYKKIRMLNKGSATLDKILSMGRVEKTTTGLGYQGDTTSLQTVFVRGKSGGQNSIVPDVYKKRGAFKHLGCAY